MASSSDSEQTLILCVVLVPLLVFYLVSFLSLRLGPFCCLRKSLASNLHRSYRVIGHRGSKCEGYPENTLPAFRRAASVPCDVVELDVWRTKDGEVVVFHDGDFGRMCGGREGHVNGTNYSELPGVVGDQPDSKALEGTLPKIPLFSEVLECLPKDMGLIVEFKESSDDLIGKVHSLLQKHGRTTNGTTVWFSLKWAINKKLRAHDPTIPRICSVEELLITLVLYYSWLLPFASLSHDVFGLPSFEINAHAIKEDLPILPMCLCHFLNLFVGGKPSAFFNVPKLVAHLKGRGYPVWILGVKDEGDVEFVKSVGATGALSDMPEWLKTSFKTQSMFEPGQVEKQNMRMIQI